MIKTALWAFEKGLNIEQLGWSDNMYGKSKYLDDVMDYVEEIYNNGLIWFKENYSEYLN